MKCLAMFLLAAAGLSSLAQSPYNSPKTARIRPDPDFAKQASEMRERAILRIAPAPMISVPRSPGPAVKRYPWKTNIVTTLFWIGERRNLKSAWDPNWVANYGGIDEAKSAKRKDYLPIAFTPQQNPFYCALPYNDVMAGQFRPEAALVIPWFKESFMGAGHSVCQHRWVAIRKGNRTCYAQWEDSGPFRSDHFQYVFQNERPKPNANRGAGLNVSPAVRDYLGLQPMDVTDWRFVEVATVVAGPWRNYGENNNFVIAKRQMDQPAATIPPK